MAATASGLAFFFVGVVAAISAVIAGRLGGYIPKKDTFLSGHWYKEINEEN